MFEASREDLAANRRVADTIVDALSTFVDSFARPDAFSSINPDAFSSLNSNISNGEDNEDNEED